MMQKGKEGFPRTSILIPILASEDAESSYATASTLELSLGMGGQSLWQRGGDTTAGAGGHCPGRAVCSCGFPAEVRVGPGLSSGGEGEMGEGVLNTKLPIPKATSYPLEPGGRNCVT